uniref:Uncharacterized protein n=1 Tax=Aegilops tauschii subsp. strangulata TaxID=200361 RepID=A0A453E7U7_AEGTS
MIFAIVKGVLASTPYSEMKRTHSWQSLRDAFLALVAE